MNKKQRRALSQLMLSGPYTVWMAGFIVIPLFLIVYYGMTTKAGAFTWENITAITSSVNLKALWLSVELSFICTVICLVLSYPLAMILANSKMKNSSLTAFLFILPMWMNALLRTLAWLTLLENNGVINTVLKAIGLPAIHIINTPTAIVFGMVYNYIPFMILPIYNVLVKLDRNVINAARDLGANAVQTFLRVILPLSVPGIISGITMVFVPSLTTFAISDILGGSKILLLGNIIEQKFKTANNWHAGSGLSLVLMVVIIITMVVSSHYEKDGESASVW
ncbi:MAG: ABC transporter permease [Lachnospiraceae bacterium]|nr:ABC transporter permease [Lachnospiraceae bacterium]